MFRRLGKLLFGLGKNVVQTWGRVLVVMGLSLAGGGLVAWTLLQGPGEVAYRLAPGQRWHYQLRYSGSGTVDVNSAIGGTNAADPGGQTQSFQSVVETELTLDVLEKDERRSLVAYSFPKSHVVLIMNGQPSPEAAAGIETELEQPVFAELDPEGRIQSLRFAPHTSDLSRNWLRSLLAGIQCVLPQDADRESGWETWEDSPHGRCGVVYQADPDAPGGTVGLLRSRQEYQQPPAQRGVGSPHMRCTFHPDGALRIAFDPHLGQVRTIEGSECFTTKVGGKVIGETESSISLKFVNKSNLPPAELVRLSRLAQDRAQETPAESLVATSASRGDRLLSQKQELGNATLESLLADLAREEKTAAEKRDHMPLYLKIKALIAVHPETSRPLGEVSSRAEAKSLTMRLVPAALAAVGHEQAQAALVATLQARANDEAVIQRLIAILSMVKSPTEQTETAMRDLALGSRDQLVAGMAQLALGTMARNLNETSPQRAAKIIAWAVNELESSTSEQKTAQLLLVLGNSGAVEALPAIRRRLADEAAAVRAAAASALRFIAATETEALLIQVLTSDSEPSVRVAAIGALAYRSMTERAFQTSCEVFRSDKAVAVRLAALNLLWQVRETFPAVAALVENAAANDPEEQVRKTARRLLGMDEERTSS
jgi:HEAT repeat protein